MGDRKQNDISRRSLLKGIAAGGAVGFIGPAAAQSDSSLASIASDEFVNSVTNTNYLGQNIQKSTFSKAAHGFPVDSGSYLVLSSGKTENIMGNPETFVSTDAGGIQIQNYSPDGYVANDVATFVVNFVVPDGAETVAFDYKFATEENPTYLDSVYQDFFEAVVFPPNDDPRNIALLPDGEPVTVQNSNEFSNSPSGSSKTPEPPLPPSPDTVFNAVTDLQTAVWNVSQYQGQEVSMFFRIADASDYIYDSAVFIDNLRFAGDVEETNLARVSAALNQYEDALFGAIDDQISAIARSEAKYYKSHGSDYTDAVLDYFGSQAGVVTDPDIDPDIKTVLDDATDGGIDKATAEQLYSFYEEMYGAASQNMTEDGLTTLFADYYRGTAPDQSTYLTFDGGGGKSDGVTLQDIIDFTQDCIIGTASTSGMKQKILQELASADISATAVERFAGIIEDRASQLNQEITIAGARYDSTADVLTAEEDFKARLVVPDTSESNPQSEGVESQLAFTTTGIIGGLSLKAILTGGAAKFTVGALGLTGLGYAGSNYLGTLSSANSLSASTYTGGQLASAGSALSSAQAIASTQTVLHYTRVQALIKSLQLIDTATSALECGTTAFQDFLAIAQAMTTGTDADGELPTDDVIRVNFTDLSVKDVMIEDQLPNNDLARGTGSVTVSNTGLVPIRPDLSASKIRETFAYTGYQTGTEYPIAFEEIPELQPGETETIEFGYLAPVGNLLGVVTDYELKIVESKSDTTAATSFDTESIDFDLEIPSTTVSDGTIGTGESISRTVIPSADADLATFTLNYERFDGDLHLYDSEGNHCGFDYSSGTIQNEIPGATHSGDDMGSINQEYIKISDPNESEYKVEVTVEEIGTVTQDVDAVETAGANTSRSTSQSEAVQPKAVSPVDSLATGTGKTKYETTMTELTPQPATMDLTPVSATASESGPITTTTTVSEVGTFEPIQDVTLSTSGDLVQENGSTSISGDNVSFGDSSVSVQAGGSQTIPVTIDVPAGLSSGTYSGTIEATGSSTDGTVTEAVPLTVTLEQDAAGPAPGTVTRTLSTTSAAPGEEVSITLEAVAAGSALSLAEQFDAPFGAVSLDSLTVEGSSYQQIVYEIDPNGMVTTLGQLSSGAVVTVEYTVTIPGDASGEDVYTINGTFDSGNVSKDIGTAEITVQDGPFQGPVADYNTDGDGDIDIIELGNAAADYANGKIDITELGQVASTYANT
ncbi:MAG: choice-of-anchor L domain-containing protein [Halorhabdus sp.]